MKGMFVIRHLIIFAFTILLLINTAYSLIYSTDANDEEVTVRLGEMAIAGWRDDILDSFDRKSADIPKPSEVGNMAPEKIEKIYNAYFEEVGLLRSSLENDLDDYIKANPFKKSFVEWEKKATEDNKTVLDSYIDKVEILREKYFSNLKIVKTHAKVEKVKKNINWELIILIAVFVLCLGLIIIRDSNFRSIVRGNINSAKTGSLSVSLPLILAMSVVSVGGFITGMYRYAIFINLILSSLIIIIIERFDKRGGRRKRKLRG
jgi:hypothetical protein